jgi:hypothetical protein
MAFYPPASCRRIKRFTFWEKARPEFGSGQFREEFPHRVNGLSNQGFHAFFSALIVGCRSQQTISQKPPGWDVCVYVFLPVAIITVGIA